MARKPTENGATRSKKKTTPSAEAAVVQPVPAPVVPEVRKNVTPINVAVKKISVDAPVNLDEEIRRRAYELYLERNGVAGDQAQDWLIAEREVRSRYASANGSALAARQGRS